MTWKKLFSWISLLCITFSLTLCNAVAESNQHIWFLLYEAGETFSLLPLVDALQTKKDYSPEIIAFGPAVNLVKEHGIDPICPIENCADITRNESLPSKALKAFNWPNNLTIITQATAQAQFDIARQSKKFGAKFILYDTNFSLEQSPTYEEKIRHLPIDMLWISICSKEPYYNKLFPGVEKIVVGDPSLFSWEKPISDNRIQEIKNQLPGFITSKKTILIGGSYGSFYKALALESMNIISQRSNDYNVIISSHPTKGWNYDEQLINKNKLNIIHAPKGVRTSELAKLSDLIFVFRSSVGIQASLAGKSVYFIEEKPNEYNDVSIEANLAKVILLSELDKSLKDILLFETKPEKSESQISEECFPRNPVEKMINTALSIR